MLKQLILLLLLSFVANPILANAQDLNQSKKAIPFAKIVRAPSFGLPVDCTLGEDCHIMNYVDMKPNDGKNIDPACGARTYDGHKGTDFALNDEIAMQNGVNVLAAMDGTIERVRNDEPDGWWDKAQLKDIQAKRKECGNAVLIRHENDVQTIYCHLKKGSIKVRPDQDVKKGDVIAQVGQSGFTQFPHLHFGVLKDRKIIDPITTKENSEKCGLQKNDLWDNNIDVKYQPLIIQSSGFKNSIPDYEHIERNINSPQSISKNSDILAFWVTILGARKGDKINIKIIDKDGKVFSERQITQDKNRARQFYFTGRKNASSKLKEGAYSGLIRIKRKEKNPSIKPIELEKSNNVLITP